MGGSGIIRKGKTVQNYDNIAAIEQGGPFWRVPTGRRDGLISKSSEVISNIPPLFGNFTTLQTLFSNQANLKANKCKNINDNTSEVEMDPGSRNTFDLSYYTLALKRRGLFESDAALTTNSDALSMINQLLQGSLDFYPECAKSMEKMGMINVKTGSNGEIRKQCALVNS
ncbi:hypothetical protein POTOM_028751 [Populus tomentosa]|uniref:peroxidase n=1 Tax=Populus tomentosa TaxID=118781 RepID=A0A8X8CLN6_POPTO|nr:hypothetical protein POTOM_028751 [Populus tomentosa]